MLLRRIGSLLIGLAGLLTCLLAVANGRNVEHAIANAQRLDRQFRQAETIIDEFRRSKSRLPSSVELDEIIPQKALSGYQISIAPNGMDQCNGSSKDYTRVQPGTYVLFAWRGEWFECFAPSTNKTTLALHERDITLSGSMNFDRFVFGILAVACFLSAWRLWRCKGTEI